MASKRLTSGAVKARQWRESRGLTQQQVADQAAAEVGRTVSRTLIAETEGGRTGVRTDLAGFYFKASQGFIGLLDWNTPAAETKDAAA